MAAAISLAVCTSITAQPNRQTSRLPTKPFVYSAVSVQLVDLLRDFAGAQGLPLVISDGVSGVVNANFQLAPEAFLDTISKAFGLIWYFDGVALYVYPSSQIQTRLLPLKNLSAETVEAKLAGFGLGDRRYPLRVQRGVALALVFGPPRHIELVEAVIAALTDVESDEGPEEVRAFTLTYASAVDRVVQGVFIPGVASALKSVYQDRAPSGPATSGGALSESIMQLDRIEGTPEQAANRDAAVRDAARSMAGGGSKPVAPATQSKPMVVARSEQPAGERAAQTFAVSANEATNTVIVRARRGKMAGIEKLIAGLDLPSEMIEIEATIIDVSTDEVDALGFDWRYQSGSRDIQVSPAATPGFNVTTLFKQNAWEFLARIRALESRGSARVVAQPKVLGAANRTAVLSDKRTASVRVAGNLTAQLFTVEAGTSLQVTPRLILDPGQTRIGMDLLIEDGGFIDQAVDQVPLVQRTTIRSEVMLNEGQSLLVGGIVSESSRKGRTSVPWLSQLPFIGAAFRYDEAGANKRQRLFMLTPKRVLLSTRRDEAAKPASASAGETREAGERDR